MAPGGSSEGERFEELYQEHWSLVFALCRARLGDHEEAMDAAQDVFVRKWRAFSSYDPARASFRTWICRNAENRVIDVLRRRGTRRREVPMPEEPGPTDPQELPEGQGYTWEEIAAITGLTIAQARAEVNRAITRLRALLRQEGVEAEP
jgi:DNA-directed RNA polymerase specialized sigma24 family protein